MRRAAILIFVCLAANAHAARFLFDATHSETSGSADWVIDADLHNIKWASGTFTTSGNDSNAQRIPTPAASGITAGTAETYWQGALSAWAVDLVKRGHSVETLPTTPAAVPFTYGTAGAQDLTNYDVVVIDEPNIAFTASEKQALLSFIAAGGSLFMISDHTASDRDNNGIDSVGVWNDFMTNNGVTNNPFGITFPSSNASGQNTFFRNVPGDPICFGPVGTSTSILYSAGNQFQIDPTKNPTVVSHLWFGTVGQSNSLCAFATVQYGNGRVVACGDSSPFDDGTGDPGDSLYTGYTGDIGGAHRPLILNASEWLAAPFAVSPASVGVTNIAPACGTTVGGTAVTITGSNFLSGATVTIGGSNATSIVVVNSNTVTAVTPANTAGAKIVQVTNTNGKFGALTNGFTYSVPPAPSNSGPTCSGQTLNLFANTNAASYSWTGPNSFTSTAQNPSVANVTTAAAGTYNLTVGCAAAVGSTTVTVNQTPATPSPSNNGPICSGQTLTLSANTTAPGYSWTGPNGFSSSAQNPSIANATTAATGTYNLTVTSNGCASAAGSTVATVKQVPATPSPSSNGPICSGQTLTLSANVTADSYSWTGPNGFSSSTQNPSIASATTAATGTYNLMVTSNGCTSAAGSTAATVKPTPATPSPSNNGPICSGQTLNLSANAIADSYSWTGPNGFSSSVQNPSIPNATTAATGTYNLSVTSNGCTSAIGSTVATVNQTPATPSPGNSGPICSGQTLTLSANATADSYSWTGPNGFTSTAQNPSIPNASAAATGTYNLTVMSNGCASAVGSTAATVNQTPATPTPSNDGPICSSNQTLNLFANTTADSYSWTGPNSFSSSAQNPSIPNATAAATGTYNLTVTSNGCTSAAGSTSATVIEAPVTPSVPAITTPSAGFCINAASVAAFTVSGTADSNITVQIYANATLIGATLADGAGNWTTNLNVIAQADGPISLTAVAATVCTSSAPSLAISGMKDATAPAFAGLNTATPAIESATLTWSAAVDSNAVTYQIFQSTTSGAENFGTPTLTTNNLSVFIAPLYPGSNSPITYFFVVRATDSCGNTETNTVEKSLQPLLDPNKSQVGDGIPNGWKQQYGLNPFDPALAAGDADGDGMSNLQEYLAGTDPTNRASVFRITSVVRAGNDVSVTWTMGPGKTNALQSTAGTGGGSYQTNGFADLFTVTDTVGTTTNYLDSGGATNSSSRYYRVRLVP